MLHSEKVYYLIGLNKYLELAVVEGTNGIYTLPKYTYEQCSKMTNGNFRFVSNNGIEFIYSDNLEKDSFSWIFLGKLIRSSTIETQKHIIKYFIENIFEVVTNPNIIDSLHFVEGLRKNDIVQIRKVPKSDLHNHIPLGGSRDILRDLTGYYVPMLSEKFSSILEMNAWCKKNIKGKLNVSNEFVSRALAAFLQAEYDGVKVFAPNFALCARKDFNSYEELLFFINSLIERFSDTMTIHPELCMDRHKISAERENEAIALLKTGIFHSIDVTGDELLGVNDFINLYYEASKLNIIRKAHVGEFSSAKYVLDAIDKLGLDTIQHGISATDDENVLEIIKERKISLTICPTSNYYLSRVDEISNHPIGKFVSNSIPVSICSDDILIFDSSVSGEYLKLYNSGVLTEFELNKIRIFGLEYYKN